MKKSEITDWLLNEVENCLSPEGFSRQGSVFERAHGTGWQRLRFSLNKSNIRGAYAFVVGVSISHDGIGQLFFDALKRSNVDVSDPMGVAPLSVNGLYICAFNDPMDIYVRGIEDGKFLVRLMGWIANDLLPFIARYSDPQVYHLAIKENVTIFQKSSQISTRGFLIFFDLYRGQIESAKLKAKCFEDECNSRAHWQWMLPCARAFVRYMPSV